MIRFPDDMPKKTAFKKTGVSASPWITHVKAYAAEHGITYREALSQAKDTYVKLADRKD